ncbi:hypothetical protein [Candidatus Nitrosotenuis aquarius]|uniref:hypothetical protein n=1 Tax=Candidatus Nitrosotenuis aquarius TaxID=1846278 RepID=UPI001FEB0B07|nr:hypothetical protein [Candidatus Nitrosotenuis aquarius]
MFAKKFQILEKTLVLRYPVSSDARNLMNLINSLVKERADIAKTKPVTIQQEKNGLQIH